MKVTVISSSVFTCPPPGYAGLEMIAYQTARGLSLLGHEVTLVAPLGSSCPGVTLLRGGPPGVWDEHRQHDNCWKHLLTQDVIIDSSWQKHSYLLKAEGVLKAPVLGVLHAPVDTMYQSLPPGVEKPCFVCISEDQKRHFEALFSREARACHNGVDTDFYKPTGAPRSGRFLFLARFSSIKGADLACEVAKKTGSGLDLVGDSSITNEPDFLAKVKSLCDGTQIRMVGPATRGECVHWFSTALALLHPNQRFREPFGLAPVEAMLCGCPVIAWDYGAMRETVSPGESGLLCKSLEEMVTHANTLKKILQPEERDRTRALTLRFSVENMVLRYQELCEEALRTGGW